MKFLIMVKATKASEAGIMPSEAMLTEMGKFNEELANAGVLLAGEGLHPSSKGVRVGFSGSTRSVVNGPFSATNELIAGFWIWQLPSLEQAIAWVKRCPNPMPGDSEIEIRQIFDSEDFGDAYTTELREQETRVRKITEDKS
ncbi:YciI family protein [Undibacterium sp. Di27W]|uniref:YciI family protein n=1 Tax=Undibacterium sp. Di27W TaxID=3413036 RepID=UPI003BEF6DD4